LQNTLALLVATIPKTTPISSNSNPRSDRFEYGIVGEVVVVVAIKSHTNFLLITLVVEKNTTIQGGLMYTIKGLLIALDN